MSNRILRKIVCYGKVVRLEHLKKLRMDKVGVIDGVIRLNGSLNVFPKDVCRNCGVINV